MNVLCLTTSRFKFNNIKNIIHFNRKIFAFRPYAALPEPFSYFKNIEEANAYIQKQPENLIKTFDEHVKDYQFLNTTKDVLQNHNEILKNEYKKVYHLEEAQIISKNNQKPINPNNQDYKKRQLMIKKALSTSYFLFLKNNKHLERSGNKRLISDRYFAYNCLGLEKRIELEEKYLETRNRLMKIFQISGFPNKKMYKRSIISTRYAKREYFAIKNLPKILMQNKDMYYNVKCKEDLNLFAKKVENDLQEEYDKITLTEALVNYKEAYKLLYDYAKRDKSLFLESNYKKIINIYENIVPEVEELFRMYAKSLHRNWNKIDYQKTQSEVCHSLKSRITYPLFSGHNLVEASKAQRTSIFLIKFAKRNYNIKKYHEDPKNLKTFKPRSILNANSLKNIDKTKKYLSKKAEKEFFDNLF